MIKKITTLVLVATSFVACKEKSQGKQAYEKNVEILENIKDTTGMTKTDLPNVDTLRLAAKKILDFRIKEENDPQSIMDVGVWKYDGIFSDGKFLQKEEVEGRWIDFDDNWTYAYGDATGIKGKGKYHFRLKDNIMIMLDDDSTKKPNEYEIKLVNDAMVMMGKMTYSDGGYQSKLTKIKERPIKGK